MAHFEAYLHVLTVGTSNKCAVNLKIMTRTLQTEANEKFGKEKVKKTAIFLDKTWYSKCWQLVTTCDNFTKTLKAFKASIEAGFTIFVIFV